MFGIESKEFLIIMLFVLILFGPERIPEVARALGRGLGDVRDALSGIERDVRTAVDTATAREAMPTQAAGTLSAASGSVVSTVADAPSAAEVFPAADAFPVGGTPPGNVPPDRRAPAPVKPEPGSGAGLAG